MAVKSLKEELEKLCKKKSDEYLKTINSGSIKNLIENPERCLHLYDYVDVDQERKLKRINSFCKTGSDGPFIAYMASYLYENNILNKCFSNYSLMICTIELIDQRIIIVDKARIKEIFKNCPALNYLNR